MTQETKLPADMERIMVAVETFLNEVPHDEERRRQMELDAETNFQHFADTMLAQRLERERIWGKKYPRFLGQRPPEPEKLKKGKKPAKVPPQKRARTNRKVKNPPRAHPPP